MRCDVRLEKDWGAGHSMGYSGLDLYQASRGKYIAHVGLVWRRHLGFTFYTASISILIEDDDCLAE